MRPIPPKLRDEMANDPFYKQCCMAQDMHVCDGRIEWHHLETFGGKQINAKWAILPVCHALHVKAENSIIREKMRWVALNRATDEELKLVSKSTPYINMRERLNKIYGHKKDKNLLQIDTNGSGSTPGGINHTKRLVDSRHTENYPFGSRL